MSDGNLAQKGRETRKALWGEASLAPTEKFLEGFDAGFAKFMNEQLFGEIWSRPGLPRKTRSMMTVAVLIALCRPHEMRVHMRGAFNQGVTQDEIKEIIIHVSQYAGVPVAMEAIRALADASAPTEA
ncbi:MAG: carboxymuconolactone decarboxylase family protein [Hyphomonadaceae bacterium]